MYKNTNKLNRRQFLKNSAAFTAATLVLGAAGTRLLGSGANAFTYPIVPDVTLNNGLKMPMLGFGTHTLNGATCVRCVSEAISVGYRLIDTAAIYRNEEFVGKGIKQSGIKREEMFITTKLWVDDSGYENSKKAFEASLNNLGVEYLDLYLYHRPRGDVKGSWKAMEELYNAGKIRAIGVSNFEPHQLNELLTYAKVKPTVNQIETHVFFQQNAAFDYLKNTGIQMQGWSPFAAGRNNVFTNPVLAAIGQKHKRSIAQVCLRWLYQRGIIAIPRSSQKVHMIQNISIWDFELDASDMESIAKLDLNTTQFPEWG